MLNVIGKNKNTNVLSILTIVTEVNIYSTYCLLVLDKIFYSILTLK